MQRSHLLAWLLALAALTVPAIAESADVSVPDASEHTSACPVTLRPEKAFLPPLPYMHRPPDPVSFWYGSSALWTEVWAPPPWTPWKAQEKVEMYWASADKSNDQQPSLVVSIKRVGADASPAVFDAPESISFTPERSGMIAELTFPSAGCWQVTGDYRGKSLSYVVQIEPAVSVSKAKSNSPSQTQSGSSPARIPSKEHILVSHRPSEPGREVLAARILANGNCPNRTGGGVVSGQTISSCDIACGGKFQRPCTEKERKRFENSDHDRWERFKEVRKMLLKQGVPFDPDILLEFGWRATLKPVFDRMPEMKQIRRVSRLSGLVMADTLYVPNGTVEFGLGTTVVIVNHWVTEECGWPVLDGREPLGGTSGGFYYFNIGQGRTLGMSLEKALKLNGLTMERFESKNQLPPFSVIHDLDLPKPHCGIPVVIP